MNGAPRRVSGPVTPRRATWRQRWMAWGIWGAIRICASTQRFRLQAEDGLLATMRREPVIFAVWHNRLALSLVVHRWLVVAAGSPERKLAAMVSASRDGAMLSAILEAFDVQPVRGSSSRRGAQALLELTSWADRGFDLAITPDGPRGPRYAVQPGVVSLASLTGRLLVPVAINLRWRIDLRSWDRFQVPLPFARCDVVAGTPLRVPREAGEEAREEARLELQRRFVAITRD